MFSENKFDRTDISPMLGNRRKSDFQSARNQLLTLNQFSLASLLLITVGVALTVRWPQVWMVILVGQIVGVVLCTSFLARNIPTGILSIMIRNCTRADGSWSKHRTQHEVSAIRVYKKALLTLFGIVLIPTNILFWLSSNNQAWFNFRVADQQWSELLGGGYLCLPTPEISDQIRLTAMAILVAWLLFSSVLVYEGYFRSLNDLLQGAKLRAREYRLADLELLPPGQEFGSDEVEDSERSADVEADAMSDS